MFINLRSTHIIYLFIAPCALKTLHPIKQNLPSKEHNFLRNFNPPNNIKNLLTNRGGIQQQT